MSFSEDAIGEPEDQPLLDEGRRRLRTSGLSDAQVNEWIATTRKRGGRIVLVPDGLRAVYG